MIERPKYLQQLINSKENGFTIIWITDFILRFIK